MEGELTGMWTTVVASHLMAVLATALTHLVAHRSAGELSPGALSRGRALVVASLILLATLTAGLLTSGGHLFSVIGALAQGVFIAVPLAWLLDAWLDVNAGLAPLARTKALLAVGVMVIGVDAFFIEPTALEVNTEQVEVLALERPVKIAVLADLQTDRITDYEREALVRIREAKPDLILIPGDLLQLGYGPPMRQLRREFKGLIAEEWGTAESPRIGPAFVVGGDVEYGDWAAMFDGLPVQVLARTTPRETVSVDALGIDVTGLGLVASRVTEGRLGRPSRRPHIVFGHAPDFALAEIDAEVLIAGHTHGGQVQLPIIGPLVTLSSVPRDWASGRTRLPEGGTLFVSRGVGMERMTAPRLRFLCRPEILIIELLPPV